MLRHRILSNYLGNVNKIIVRKKSVVIRQIDTTKLTKAQRIKKQNYETSYLFGSKKKYPNETVDCQITQKDEKGIDSEIYWTLKDNDSEVENINSKSKNSNAKKSKNKNSVKKIKELIEEEKITEKFAKFKLDLPKPVKVTIQDALNNIDPQTGEPSNQNEIPFDDQLLKNLTNFPLVIDKKDLIVDMFSQSTVIEDYSGTIPSVSKILQGTMSPSQKKALLQWKNLKIAELGLQGFEDLQQAYLLRGKRFHNCLQKYFNNEEMIEDELSSDIVEVWKSISHVIKDFETPAVLTECQLSHPYLSYKGVVDCVAVHRKTNTLSVIEWKNSDRYKRTVGETYDAPIQLCAYLSALNATKFIDEPLTNGIIVVAYNDGQKADLFHLASTDIKKYWRVWLNRLQDYWIRYRDNTLSLDEI